jgi:5-methylcytosine-specific restriction endonuclease McrA
MRSLLGLVLVTLLLSSATAADRSRVVRAEFQRLNPCPVNGATRGACPGFEVDHVIALCSGGRDEIANLEWRTREDHALKTSSTPCGVDSSEPRRSNEAQVAARSDRGRGAAQVPSADGDERST